MLIEQQQQQEAEQDVLGRIYSGKQVSEKELAKVSPQNQAKAFEFQRKKQVGKSVYDALIKAGYPKETAALWQSQLENSPVGGQTDVIRNVNELLKRSPEGKGIVPGEEKTPKLAPPLKIPGIEDQAYDLNFPELESLAGRSSADIVKEEAENKKTNAPLYAETLDSLNSLDEDYRDFTQLQEYNRMPGALPTGLGKWNVDYKNGELIVAAQSTPETQDYVKIIARLLGRAKEYFPGRVTNFDLDQFSKRFPRLSNSPEGRELITKQLMLANRIAYLKDETLKAAIEHYGSQADPMQVRRYANENYRRLKPQLENQLKELNRKNDEIYKTSLAEEPELPEGMVEVTYKGQKGTMSREQFEKAKQSKFGNDYELVR